MTATATATTTISAHAFAGYAMGMKRRFRGFATVEATTTIANGKIKGGKGSGYEGRITKHTKCQVSLNPRLEGYEDSVNKQRAREHNGPIETLEHFEAKPRSWGVHVEDTSFVVHTKKGESIQRIYLEVRVIRSLATTYFIDGQPVAKETAEALLHPNRESGRQGTSKAIILRDYEVGNLTRVRWTCPEGTEYDLTIT